MEYIHYHMPYRDRHFRNAMAHYSLFVKIKDDEIDESVIGYGLFEKYFGVAFHVVNEEMITELKKTRDSIEEYVII